MREKCALVVVVPIGPACSPEFVSDTIDSAVCYTTPNRKIILADDSGARQTGAEIAAQFSVSAVIRTRKNNAKHGGLYLTLCQAYRHALEHYDFACLLRLDTDALVIGPSPELDAIRLFSHCREVAQAGRYLTDMDGNPNDSSWPACQLVEESRKKNALKHPLLTLRLRALLRRAVPNGYKYGENVFGGACFVSPHFLERLLRAGLLPAESLGSSKLEEDHIFGLLAKAVGMDFGDLCAGNGPFGVTWRGLPCSPEELVLRGKKVIHSTRYWQRSDEAEIRRYFREIRSKLPIGTPLQYFSYSNSFVV